MTLSYSNIQVPISVPESHIRFNCNIFLATFYDFYLLFVFYDLDTFEDYWLVVL